MFKKFLIILLILIAVSCDQIDIKLIKSYNHLQLNSGLPDARSLLSAGKITKPFFAEINSFGFCENMYFVMGSEDSSYTILINSLDRLFSAGSYNFNLNKDGLFESEIIIGTQNSDLDRVKIEFLIYPGSKNLYYGWPDSKNKDKENPGGYPELIKSRLPIGEVAPNFNLTTNSGKNISLGSYRGKYVLLDFWGTWCGGCLHDLQYIYKVRETLSENELFVLGLAFDKKEKLDLFLKQNSFNYPNAIISEELIKKYDIVSFPTKILIDKEGKVVQKRFYGPKLTDQILEEMNL